MQEVRSQRPAEPVSNLDLKSQTTSQGDIKLIVKGVKCRCKKAWCPRCGVMNTIKRFVRNISNWDWQYVRQVVLTVDYKLYKDPEEALKTINGKHHIANLVRNLERTKGIKVIDWQWVLEWYKNGLPHWHLFLLVDKAGWSGQIGFKNIVQYWKSGWIKESYIKNEKHWNQITGYFEKHGYFNKNKAHQSRLPEWARNKTYVIRRTGGKTHPTDKKNYIEKEKFLEREERRKDQGKRRLDELLTGAELGAWFLSKADGNGGKTEGEKIDACGCETDLYLGFGFKNYLGRAKIPYREFRAIKGEFVENEGYIIKTDNNQLNDFMTKIHNPMDWSVYEPITNKY